MIPHGVDSLQSLSKTYCPKVNHKQIPALGADGGQVKGAEVQGVKLWFECARPAESAGGGGEGQRAQGPKQWFSCLML